MKLCRFSALPIQPAIRAGILQTRSIDHLPTGITLGPACSKSATPWPNSMAAALCQRRRR